MQAAIYSLKLSTYQEPSWVVCWLQIRDLGQSSSELLYVDKSRVQGIHVFVI
jgi:hypothetical protein